MGIMGLAVSRRRNKAPSLACMVSEREVRVDWPLVKAELPGHHCATGGLGPASGAFRFENGLVTKRGSARILPLDWVQAIAGVCGGMARDYKECGMKIPSARPDSIWPTCLNLAGAGAAWLVAQVSTACAGDTVPSIATALLPRDLSPWSMFQQADIVVKAVMVGLVIASIVTWTVWLAKSIELSLAGGSLRRALQNTVGARSLGEARQRVGQNRGVVVALIEAAEQELILSAGIADKTGKKERVASSLIRLEAAAGRAMLRGTGVLATIGSTAPFVGLFGTVWGIMNSFIGISKAQTTNLAVVAPGIAEALLATALGLVAAIPAVIIYNHFARSTAGYKALVADASAEVQRLVSRDLDRPAGHVTLAQAAE